jgi:hypothetical protein
VIEANSPSGALLAERSIRRRVIDSILSLSPKVAITAVAEVCALEKNQALLGTARMANKLFL